MDRNLTVAIIGAGQMAGCYDMCKAHADTGVYTHAGAYTRDGRFLLRMVCDLDLDRACQFQKYWNVRSMTTRLDDIYGDYHDIISVCTPDDTHFSIIENIIRRRACKTVFAEKPLALKAEEIYAIMGLAQQHEINVVVNFQRRFDSAHEHIRQMIAQDGSGLLAANAYYMKGLEHNGVTLIDTLTYLCGMPHHVLAHNRVFNKLINAYTYEFILYFDTYTVAVQTIDTELAKYHYHIFAIDLFFPDKRVTINDNSRNIETRCVIDYVYPGVKTLDDKNPQLEETGFSLSMLNAVAYLHDITINRKMHTLNTPNISYATKHILDAIVTSYQHSQRIEIGEL